MIKSKWALVITAVVMTSSILCSSYPANARSILDILFGDKEADAAKGPPPEVTLQAPFPTSSDKSFSGANSELLNMYDAPSASQNSTSLNQPHRSPQQISEWASGIVSQAMTINPPTWDTDFAKISSDFTPFAAQEYKKYVQDSNFINILNSNQMRLQAISNDSAIVTKEGEISGTYHWLIQIPLMTSFYKTTMKEVDKNATAQSQSLVVQVQVGRIPTKKNTDIGLVVERWHVSSAATR